MDTPLSPLSRHSPSALSIPSLGLTRPFPSSRSSFLQSPSAALVIDTSGAANGVDKPREAFEREREAEKEKEKEKPSRRPLFSEQEAQLVTRNASDLLALHEKFVKLLEQTLEPLGFASLFSQTSAEGRKRALREDQGDRVGRNVDEAVEAVAELFTHEVCRLDSMLSVMRVPA